MFFFFRFYGFFFFLSLSILWLSGLLSSCAGRKEVVRESPRFIPNARDIHIRNVLNFSSAISIDVEAQRFMKEFLTTYYPLPLNNYEKTATLLADVDIVDYKIIPIETQRSSYKQNVFWTKIRLTLLSPRSMQTFVDRMTYTVAIVVEDNPSYGETYEREANRLLFYEVAKSIAEIVEDGKPKLRYNYDMLAE